MWIEYIGKFIDFDNLTKQNNVILSSIYGMIIIMQQLKCFNKKLVFFRKE